jgi:HK97 family phage major capsid protein
LLLVFANSSVAATLTITGTLTGGTGAGAVTFSSTDEKICTVSNLGVVTGVKVGECAIVATKAASSGYLEAKSNPVILKVTDSPADIAAAKAKADADAAAVVKAKADADAATAAKAKADADAAAVAKAKADADAAVKAKADADAVAAKIAEAKAQADAAVKAAADAKAAAEKATADAKAAAEKAAADAKAAADLAAATAQAKVDSDAAIAKIAAANAMTIGVRSKSGYTTIKTDLADKYSGMKAVVQLIVVKSGKTTYVTLGTIYLDELGKGYTQTKTVIAKGQKVRVTVAGKVIKTVMK